MPNSVRPPAWLVLALCLLMSHLLLRQAAAQDGHAVEAEQVQSDVRQVIEALYKGDIETPLRFTHPKILQQLGGADGVRPQLQAAARKFSELGMKLDSMVFPAPPRFFEGGGMRFVVVPTLSVISFKSGDRAESLNYQLGVLDPGRGEWTYIEGSRINAQSAQALFPGFPADFKFPEFYRKKLPKE